jgi:hypothetical protein
MIDIDTSDYDWEYILYAEFILIVMELMDLDTNEGKKDIPEEKVWNVKKNYLHKIIRDRHERRVD